MGRGKRSGENDRAAWRGNANNDYEGIVCKVYYSARLHHFPWDPPGAGKETKVATYRLERRQARALVRAELRELP